MVDNVGILTGHQWVPLNSFDYLMTEISERGRLSWRPRHFLNRSRTITYSTPSTHGAQREHDIKRDFVASLFSDMIRTREPFDRARNHRFFTWISSATQVVGQ